MELMMNLEQIRLSLVVFPVLLAAPFTPNDAKHEVEE
jgi:hypothetical protein